uniref:Src kinase associated phosphoprotein 1 n=1 Tax=Anas platyrhynchos platyrhynchos TaxID=8840 RepID=U3IK51_ANAPP
LQYSFSLPDAECYLADGLQNENLSPNAREQRDAILFSFQQVKARYVFKVSGGIRASPFGLHVHVGCRVERHCANWKPQSFALLPAGLEEVTPRPVQDTGNILKQGYLEKRSRDHSFFGSEWQKRWCVLNKRTFFYYANEKSKQPKGTFSIEQYSARLAFHLRKDSRRRCCFELICPGKRTYEFTAPSPAEAEDWVDQIQFLMKDLSSLTIPYDEEDEEDLYNDVDSSDSVTTASHNTTLNPDDGMEEDDVYEVFPEIFMVPKIFVVLLLPEEISAQRFPSGIQTAAGSGAEAPGPRAASTTLGTASASVRLSSFLLTSVYIVDSLGSSCFFLQAHLR